MVARSSDASVVVPTPADCGGDRAWRLHRPGSPRTREAGNLSIELIDPKVFRVCGDPRNMPFSTEDGGGYENKIAALFAGKLGKNVAYAWYPGSPGSCATRSAPTSATSSWGFRRVMTSSR